MEALGRNAEKKTQSKDISRVVKAHEVEKVD